MKYHTTELLKKNNLENEESYIKIIVTRPHYKEKFKFDFYSSPNIIIIAKKLKPPDKKNYSDGLSIISSSIKREPYNNIVYRHKLLNYFENIYAKNEAYFQAADEAFFMTKDKLVLECASSNIFIVKNNRILTPPLTQNILPGITRRIVIDICKLNNIFISERKIHYFDLIKADEVFITNAIAGIVPVKSVNLHYISKDLIPGPLTNKVLKFYNDFNFSD